jgi:hypothetical protein
MMRCSIVGFVILFVVGFVVGFALVDMSDSLKGVRFGFAILCLPDETGSAPKRLLFAQVLLLSYPHSLSLLF